MNKIIAITMNVLKLESVSETRDSLDQEWTILFESLGYTPLLVPNSLNDPVGFLSRFNPDGLLISGGNNISATGAGDAPERERTENVIIPWFLKNKKTILGVCRGMQALNVYFNGSLKKVKDHVRVIHKIETNELFPNSMKVNSFHDFAIPESCLSEELIPLAFHIEPSGDKTVESFRHKSKNVFAIMWHPERSPLNQIDNLNFIKHVFGEKK
jgi:putative glutamine amidotransferase